MAISSDDEIKAAVTMALKAAPTSADESSTLVQLVRGQLRLALSPLPLDQVAGKMVDLFLQGRRNTPPNDYRPELSALVGSACQVLAVPAPSAGVTAALVNVACGWMIDQSLPTLPGARTGLVQHIAGIYLVGA